MQSGRMPPVNDVFFGVFARKWCQVMTFGLRSMMCLWLQIMAYLLQMMCFSFFSRPWSTSRKSIWLGGSGAEPWASTFRRYPLLNDIELVASWSYPEFPKHMMILFILGLGITITVISAGLTKQQVDKWGDMRRRSFLPTTMVNDLRNALAPFILGFPLGVVIIPGMGIAAIATTDGQSNWEWSDCRVPSGGEPSSTIDDGWSSSS